MRPSTSTTQASQQTSKRVKKPSSEPKKRPLSKTKQRQILQAGLEKANVKFEKACKQLIVLDRKINDLHNLYTSSMETDRKTFKIVNRMQLATLEATHEAYIEYIERKVNEIRKLKTKIYGNQMSANTTVLQ
jgi:hypothetical protein